VKDTGIGIPEDRTTRLFRSFSQGDISISRKYGGTGLGLAISKRLTELMGGTMWIESQIGQGSTFHFTIAARADQSVQPAYLSSVPVPFLGCRVLIVDANATSRRVLAAQLQSWSMRPVAVASSEEALALIQESMAFDLAILDMQMPGMDGLTLAGEIRRYRDASALPLLMLTSLGQRIDDAHCGDFAAALAKPIKTGQLYDTLITILANSTRAQLPDNFVIEPDDEQNLFDPGMAQRLPFRLLVVEDNEINQEVLVQMLAQLGYHADIAENGLIALEALGRETYDIILMDVQMPQMDGLETTRRIRGEIASSRQPCIIAVTANVVRGEREECFVAGMDDYISKPIDPHQLIAAIEQASVRPQAATPAIGAASATPAARPPPATPQTKQAADGALLNTAALQRLNVALGHQAAMLLPNLFKSFAENAGRLRAALHEVSPQSRLESLHRAAHTLKSNSDLFGAPTLAELCRNLERRTKAGSLEGAEEMVTQIETEFARVQTALETILLDLRAGKLSEGGYEF
jgi:CheY-like chemotaxis protein/HPt (histidine-containing phosphotransfer) domain-containing protein